MKKSNSAVATAILVAVYGSLRQGFGNHGLLSGSDFLGEFTTEPKYTMYSLGGFPAVVVDGDTALKVEVYSVTPDVKKDLDGLEGYVPGRKDNFYDAIEIETPYGNATMYVMDGESRQNYLAGRNIVASGDWADGIQRRK
jgi:gamma-glutamylcyclotransferase (GGCT)/AIG2-like uncharacterized protein YtfP